MGDNHHARGLCTHRVLWDSCQQQGGGWLWSLLPTGSAQALSLRQTHRHVQHQRLDEIVTVPPLPAAAPTFLGGPSCAQRQGSGHSCCPQHPPLGLNFTTSLECRAGSLPQSVPVAAAPAPAICRSACSLKRDTSDHGHPLEVIFLMSQSVPEPEAEQFCPAIKKSCTKDPPGPNSSIQFQV